MTTQPPPTSLPRPPGPKGLPLLGPALAYRRDPTGFLVDTVRRHGDVVYTRYIYFFQGAGLVLLVAMVGAIVLTLRHRPNVRRQNAGLQSLRTVEEAIEIRKVRPGEGLR